MALLPQVLIGKKRDGEPLDADEIAAVVAGITDGTWSEGQIAALAMATLIRGMSAEEQVALTTSMTRSGRVLDWGGIADGRAVVDKHSTGGIGDKVSLILAPCLAACGVCVPMISGRGLGHTGGTLDKLEAIPGYRVSVPLDDMQRVVDDVGCAIVGATADIAPADARLYAVRDLTGTVESQDLIVASILSKKLAEGLDALVMDVKVGAGAFLPTMEAALDLAKAIVRVASGAGVKTTALVTDMNQMLGLAAGNALEVAEVADVLTARQGDRRLVELVVAQGAALLQLAEPDVDRDTARQRIVDTLTSGAAAERFGRMVHALGGPADFVERAGDHLPRAQHTVEVPAPADGHVAGFDLKAIGWALVDLGAGRRTPGQAIDPVVGLTTAGIVIGDEMKAGDPVFRLHGGDKEALEAAAPALSTMVRIGDAAGPPPPLIHTMVG